MFFKQVNLWKLKLLQWTIALQKFNVLVCMLIILALSATSILPFPLSTFLPIMIYYLNYVRCNGGKVQCCRKNSNIEVNLYKLKLPHPTSATVKFYALLCMIITFALATASNLRFPLSSFLSIMVNPVKLDTS